ncbi:MAG: hypothetical protein IPF59_08050 [Ignavibacteria bacterium]|nr:hypothetical protein [Ignavibacteria bacterium]MBK7412765.1 hypothetical protein [Ignavibacteria bacterium]
MNVLTTNVVDLQGRDLVETVVTDLRDHVIGKEREFFGADISVALLERLSADTEKFYRVLHAALYVWSELDAKSVELVINLAAECHSVLLEIDSLDETERYSSKFVNAVGDRYVRIRERFYKPSISIIGSVRYMQSAGLYDETAEATQKRLDETFEAFRKKAEIHTDEQMSKLRIALQAEVSNNVSQKTIEEIAGALKWMRIKAALSAALAMFVAGGAVAFVLYNHDSEVSGSYQIASSIVRRITIVTIGLLAVGVLIRLFRSYVSSIEGLQHKKRLLKSFQELLVMGGPENSQHVFAQLIAILVKHDFTLQTGEKAEDHESSIIAGLVAAVQKSAIKT